MVYITSWADYQRQAEALYEKSPIRTRYIVKWRASQGILVLKITDDVTCLKYKTHSAIILNRFEALNLSLMRKMRNRAARPDPPPSRAVAETAAGGQSSIPGTPQLVAPGTTAAQTVPTSAAAKKKKKKGKK